MCDTQALYDKLRAEAGKFVSVSTLSLEDVRQTLYLMCLEHAMGLDAFNPLLGTPESYIMGRMWGIVERWRPPISLEVLIGDNEATDDGGARIPVLPTALQIQGIDETLIAADQLRIEEQIRSDLETTRRCDVLNLPTIAAMAVCYNRSSREIARRWGKSSGRLKNALSKQRRDFAG